MTPQSFSIDDAAKRLQCSRRTIYTRIREGRLQTVKAHTSTRITTESLQLEATRPNRPKRRTS